MEIIDNILLEARVSGFDGVARCTFCILEAMNKRILQSHKCLNIITRSPRKGLSPNINIIYDYSKPYTKDELEFFSHAVLNTNASALICMDYRVPIRKLDIPLIVVIHDIFRYTDHSLCYNDSQFIKRNGSRSLQPMSNATKALSQSLDHFGIKVQLIKKATTHERYYATALTWAVHSADHIVTGASSTVNQILDLFPNAAPISCVAWGVDHVTNPAGELPKIVKKPFILYVGQQRTHKNFKTLVEAFAAVRSIVPDVTLVCVGSDFEKGNDLQSLFDKWNISSVVHLLGIVDDFTLAKLYQEAACLVHLSKNEGFGFTPYEALHAGGRVIVSDIPVFRERLEGHVEFVNPSDIVTIKSLMISAIRNPYFDYKQGQKYVSQFTWNKTVEEFLDITKKLVERKKNYGI